MKAKHIRTLEEIERNDLIDQIIETLKSYELLDREIAEVVELYYDCQDLRIANANKKRTEPPSKIAEWLQYWLKLGEKVAHNKLAKWLEGPTVPAEAIWALEQIGIGPVIAAGLAAHIDVARTKHVSSLWKFAGLAPGFDRKVKGQKLPYNARLKVLAWKLGESFVKVSNKEGATYGHIYAQFKAQEIQKNESGQYAEQAKHELATKDFKRDNVTKKRLLEGKLSDAHLHRRACRKAAKVFLQHYWIKARTARGLPVSQPYAFEDHSETGFKAHDPSSLIKPEPEESA